MSKKRRLPFLAALLVLAAGLAVAIGASTASSTVNKID
jgi:hypothetical protein